MVVRHRLPSVVAFTAVLLVGCSGLSGSAPAADEALQALPGGGGIVRPTAVAAAMASGDGNVPPPAARDGDFPFYMPMEGLRRPANRLFIKCDESQASGRQIYQGRDGASLYGRAEGGFEFIYEATDDAGRPCVYPFEPWMPQIVGNLDGTQYIIRSSVPGRAVTFRTSDQWASIGLRIMEIGSQRVHFELRDVNVDFPGAIQPMGALHLEAFGGDRDGLFTAVVRRSRLFGGKNAIFVPAGQTMLYVEDSDIAGNVGTNNDQEHSTYINGIIASHMRRSRWHGQLSWQNIASGHQLKDKSYLRIYEDVTVSNASDQAAPSAMALIDASAYGFTWSNNLHLERLAPAQEVREGLVDLRTDMLYGRESLYPWPVLVNANWRMPAQPLGSLDQVYLSVFQNTSVDSFRTEPFVFALRPQGTRLGNGEHLIDGNDQSTRAQQRMVSLAFNTSGRAARVFAPGGWTYADPQLPANSQWVRNRDAFITHALGLIGR